MTTNTFKLQKGTEVIFTPTGKKIRLVTVTDKNVTWFTSFQYKGGTGKNKLKMARTSLQKFNAGILEGTYVLA